MPDFVGVFGFEITRPIQAGIFAIEPCFTQHNEAKDKAEDRSHFFLTAVGQLKEEPYTESIFDLAAALTFCQQRWVMVTGPFRLPDGTTVDQMKEKLPSKLDIPAHRQGGGTLLLDDTFSRDSRERFLDLCLRQLQDQPFIERTGFRTAFFRSVETWRLEPMYIDITYYLDFSAVEILARTAQGDYNTPIAQVATQFLSNLGFDVVQDNPSQRVRAVQTYAHLRNALFHRGQFEARFQENNKEVVLKLVDYEDYWRRLVPDVLLKVLGFDDGHINWNRWLDRMPFGS